MATEKHVKDFKIIIPGGCNAKCPFCFWENTSGQVDWLGALENALRDATSDFQQLNISGGEPTLSPYFKDTMEIVAKYRSKFPKVVLTTNGTNLHNVYQYMDGVVDHLNISRHHYSDEVNRSIFGTDTVPNQSQLKEIIQKINDIGIDVTFNSLVNADWKKEDLINFVNFAKSVNASYLVFRHDYSQGLESSQFEAEAKQKIVYTFRCDVCRTNVRIVNGMYVSWKYGVLEPSEIFNQDDVFEIILGQNGKLTADYKGLIPFSFKK